MTISKKGKRTSVTALGMVMTASALVPSMTVAAEEIGSFPDVPSDHEAYQAVKDLVAAGVVNGYVDETFKPEQSVIRSEAAKMIALNRNLDTNVPSTNFSDVESDRWYTDYVNALYDQGVINGYVDGTFGPNKEMIRSEFAKMVVEAYDMEIKRTELPFTDVEKDKWYSPYIETLYANGLIKGTSGTTFSPNDEMRRIDFALLLANSDYKFGDKLPKPTFELTVMHTNDTHANLESMPQTVTAVNEVREEKPDSLLLSAGDVMSGTLYFNEFQGQADLQFMNLMDYDAMTFGNHEFDLGSSEEGLQALKDFVEGAHFPFVSANVDFSKDDKFTGLFSNLISSEPENGKIYNGIVKEVNGEKVGIFGLTTAETADIASPGAVTFEEYKTEAEKAVAAFEGMGVDKIVALTHIGFDDNAAIDNDLTLAAEVEGIDVIVGGHSHTELAEPFIVDVDKTGTAKDPTIIVQTGANNANLGVVDVEFDENGVVVGQAGQLISIGDQEPDAEAVELLEPYKEKVGETSLTEIGVTTEFALENPRTGDDGNTTGESVRKNETILGNIITDGMLVKAKEYNGDVVMAFQNGGGIRASIDAGPITAGEVITVLPFGNTLATMDLTGSELKEAFEISFKSFPEESGGFLHVAGAKVEFDSSKPAGERVVSIAYENEDGTFTEVQDGETYTIATNAFTAKGGDGYDVFAEAYADNRVTDLGLSDWENLQEQLVIIGSDGIPTEIEGRIVDIGQ